MKKTSALTVIAILLIAAAIILLLNPTNSKPKTSEVEPNEPVLVEGFLGQEKAIMEKVNKLVAQMNDKEKIGQLVMFTPTSEADDFSNKMIKEYLVGSALLNRHMSTAAEYANFTNQLQKWASETKLAIPIIISGDMEYGAAQRAPQAATILPRQMAIGATGNVQYAEQAAKITAKEAKAMGFHWSYSPVADVNSNLINPVIGVRSFGEDTQLVSDMAVAELKGYQSEGVMSSAKHFPGHGDTGFDTHSTLSKVSYNEQVLREVHLPPFKAVIDQGIESIMTSHIIIEAIDPELPATLSKKVLTGLLREDLGFKGIIITDAMVMQAISSNWGAGAAAVMAVNAGADIVMANGSARDQLDTLDTLYEALQSRTLERERVDQSVERILYYKFKFNLFDNRQVDVANASKVVGQQAHRDMAAQIALDSITLVKNEGVLPYDPKSNDTTLVVSMAYADQIADMVREIVSGEVISYQAAPARGEPLEASAAAIDKAIVKAKEADRIIVFTQADRQLPEGQIDLVNRLQETGKPLAAVSLSNPGDILGYPDVKAYLATFSLDNWYWMTPIPVSWNAAVKVIFGEEPKGKLPVTISEAYPKGFGLSYK